MRLAVIPGDGIGIEVMQPALEVLRLIESTTTGLKFLLSETPAGAGYFREHGVSIP